jgi:L-2-hydroxyglutarate oxidase LhgO
MTADIETIVVGAGVVGLATAQHLARAGREVMVLEQHALIGSEVSSRNSEVIHAGLYYPPGSLRATLCVRGKKLMYAFARENGVAHEAITKLLVATSEAQLPKLKAIQDTALKNGVDDLQPMTAAEARKLEPELACAGALLSPSTGIIDSHGYMVALEGHLTTHGGQVVLETPVTAISRGHNGLFTLSLGPPAGGTITCETLVLSAGLHVSKLARTLAFGDRYVVPETYYAKGQYYALSGKSPFARHIYPMPDGAWLGLHATVDLGGRCKFGPDIEWQPEIDYSFDATKIEKFLDFIRSYYPGLDPSQLHADYTGVRPKLYREGEAVPDFRIDGPETHGMPGLVILAGIESPGLTASLAIAEVVAGKLDAAVKPAL